MRGEFVNGILSMEWLRSTQKWKKFHYKCRKQSGNCIKSIWHFLCVCVSLGAPILYHDIVASKSQWKGVFHYFYFKWQQHEMHFCCVFRQGNTQCERGVFKSLKRLKKQGFLEIDMFNAEKLVVQKKMIAFIMGEPFHKSIQALETLDCSIYNRFTFLAFKDCARYF